LKRAITIRFNDVLLEVPSIPRCCSRNWNPHRRWRALHQERRTTRSLSVRSNGTRTRRSALPDRHGNADDLRRVRPQTTWVLHQPRTDLDLPEISEQGVALFKHETLGLPNGRKRNLSIPEAFRTDAHLMRPLARELLAIDGVLGFYNAGGNNPHKYPRIQIKLKARLVIEQLATFLQADLGISASCRSTLSVHEDRSPSLQQILQVNRAEDIETWRREIGFSNPSHISRMMVFETLGECVPRTSIVDPLSFLCGYSSSLVNSKPIAPSDLVAMVDTMTTRFGFPRVRGEAILREINENQQAFGIKSKSKASNAR
jgi:hypothetical protein